MRIIGGALKGRRLKSPSWDGLRPTSDKLRETLFKGWAAPEDVITQERFQEAKEKLFATDSIDIDFRRMIGRYWETFLLTGGDPAAPGVERVGHDAADVRYHLRHGALLVERNHRDGCLHRFRRASKIIWNASAPGHSRATARSIG